jgi:hypothetical protein
MATLPFILLIRRENLGVISSRLLVKASGQCLHQPWHSQKTGLMTCITFNLHMLFIGPDSQFATVAVSPSSSCSCTKSLGSRYKIPQRRQHLRPVPGLKATVRVHPDAPCIFSKDACVHKALHLVAYEFNSGNHWGMDVIDTGAKVAGIASAVECTNHGIPTPGVLNRQHIRCMETFVSVESGCSIQT